MAISAFRAGEPEHAADMLVALSGFDWVRGTPDEIEFLALAGELFDSAGRYDAAVGAHSRALDLAPGDPGHWINRALARASLGDFEGTIADLDRALGLDPGSVEALVFRGSAYRAVGELDRATDDALQALLLEPDNLPGLWLAADVARAEGDAASARSFLQRIIASEVAGWRDQAEAALQDLNTLE
jgi:tetratricopeptide (TPR) repeat protein